MAQEFKDKTIDALLTQLRAGATRDRRVIKLVGSGKPVTDAYERAHIIFGLYVLGVTKQPVTEARHYDSKAEAPAPDCVINGVLDYLREGLDGEIIGEKQKKRLEVRRAEECANEISDLNLSLENLGNVLFVFYHPAQDPVGSESLQLPLIA